MKRARLAGVVAAGLLMAVLLFRQYLTVSNVPLSRAWWSDTLSYGEQFSLLPLKRPFSTVIFVASPIAFFPLGTVLRSGETKTGDAWQKRLGATLFPVESGVLTWRGLQTRFAVFVAINSSFWILAVGIALLGFRRRRRASHVRA